MATEGNVSNERNWSNKYNWRMIEIEIVNKCAIKGDIDDAMIDISLAEQRRTRPCESEGKGISHSRRIMTILLLVEI